MKILSNGLAVLENDAWASAWVEQHGSLQYDSCIEPFLKPLLSPGQTAIDIGAYIGGYAGPFVKFVFPGGIVHAFEPNPEPFACLLRNCPEALCHNVALGRCAGTAFFHEDKINRGASFILTDSIADSPAISIPICTLDSFGIKNVRLIKIDVEGMELDVLRGGIDTIMDSRPVMYLEINHGAMARAHHSVEELLDFMNQIDYRLSFIDSAHSLNKLIWPQLDVFFKPNERIE